MAQMKLNEFEQHAAIIDKQQLEAMAERICRDVAEVGAGDKYRVNEVWKGLSACLTVLEGSRWML